MEGKAQSEWYDSLKVAMQMGMYAINCRAKEMAALVESVFCFA